MARKKLCLDNLGDLDHGLARAIVDKAISMAVDDCDDRGEDGKPRKVSIQLTLTKLKNGMVAAFIEAGITLPKLRTADHFAETKQESGQTVLSFQEYDVNEPKQSSIDEQTT